MRLIFFILSAIALLLVAAVIGPSFVDWNKYKPQIVTQVKNATGLDVTVNGDLSLSVIPSPRVKIEELVVASPHKIQFDNLLSMKSAEVSVALLPLLQKQIKVDSVTLVEPDIQIEIMEDGMPSWQTEKLKKAEEVSDVAPTELKTEAKKTAGKALDSVALDRLEIKKGNLSFINHQTKARQNADDVNLVMKADTLKGPFDLEGSLIYNDKKIAIESQTGKLPTGNEGLKIQAEVSLPEAGSSVDFGGVASIKAPYDVQGQTTIKISSPAKLARVFGAGLGTQFDQALMLDGLLSADQNKVTYNDLKLSFGDFVGNGKISVQNLQSKNPLIVNGDIKSSSVLNLEPFIRGSKKSSSSSSDMQLKNAGKTTKKSDGFVPQSLTLPMPIDASVKIDVAGVKVQGHALKGVFVDLQKNDKTSKVVFKALELPGQGRADGTLNIAYASQSKAKGGQVVYADPTVSYEINGQTGQLAAFLKAFAPKADTSAVTKLYKTAQFNLKGEVNNNSISLKDSTLKLDALVVGLGGRYQPAGTTGRAKAVIDVSAGSVNVDQILAAQGVKPKTANDNKNSASKGSAKEALKPIQGMSLPLDLVFDVSLQKAHINQADLEGLRLTGELIGNRLTLKNASVNNFAGATMSLKGSIADLSKLSGLDLTAYTKTKDLPTLASALKVDISKLPDNLKALEVTVSGKGSADALEFKSNIKALGGQLDAAGKASNPLDNPSFENLSVRLKHSNLVKAIQVASPSFKGAAGLQQPIDFYTEASSSGKVYTLSNMKTTLGNTDFKGNLKINTDNKIPSVNGSIIAGKIALDDLLGAKKSSGSKSSGGGSTSGNSSSKGRWSTAPIDLNWMNAVDINVDLAASSIQYGKWNFTQPATGLKIGNGQMSVSNMKAGVFGGQATLSTEVKAKPVSLILSSDMNNIDLEALAKALSGGGKLKSSGTVSFSTNVNSTGNSANALINALGGKANLNGFNVILKGFDLAKLARGLAVDEKLATSVTSLIDGATSGGQTQFDTVKGDYAITNGKVNIGSMVMDGPAAVINSTGYADLPKWFLNVDNEITLKDVSDMKPISVKIKGPIDNPSDTFGKNILEDYLGDKIRRKIGKEIPGILGDDASNLLEGLGIIPKQQAPTPTPAEAAPSETPAQPVAPAPKQEPKKIEKPEDAVNELLNSENPEEALGNVLKGLF